MLFAKQAFGGQGQDIPFEQAFSDVAHTILRDRAPQLFDHEIGFQLVDRDDDGSKAFGVMGFKIGSMLLYAPLFFLNGATKGHELLIIADRDMFVPLKENWINELTARKPLIIGDAVAKKTTTDSVRKPSLRSLIESPSTKYASAAALQKYAAWSRDGVAIAVKAAANEPESDIRPFLAKGGLPLIGQLLKAAEHYPIIGKRLLEFYSPEDIRNLIDTATKEASQSEPSILNGKLMHSSAAKAAQDLFIYTYDVEINSSLPSDLSAEEKQQLANEQLLVKDTRPDNKVTQLAGNSLPRAITNPSQTGIYDVVTGPDKYTKCFVAKTLVSAKGSASFSVVIPLEKDTTKGVTADNSLIWVGSAKLLSDYENWFDKLEGVTPKAGLDKYILVSESGICSTPFVINYVHSDSESKMFNVRFECYPSESDSSRRRRNMGGYESDYYGPQRVIMTAKKGSKLRSDGRGNVYAPEGCKFVLFEKASEEDRSRWEDRDREEKNKAKELTLGRPADVLQGIGEKSATVRVQKDHAGYLVLPLAQRFTTKTAATISLIRDLGFRKSAAEQLLADVDSGKQDTFTVKYADEVPPYLMQSGMSSPVPTPQDFGTFDGRGSSYALQMPDQQMIPYENSGADPSGMNNWRQPPQEELPEDFSRQIADAAASGQKEVFDTSILTTMLRANRDDLVVDRWIPDLVKAMDRLGRTLFNFYWKQSVFADRYGQGKLPEIEDSLRNMFEGMGDLILQLKQQGVDPFQDEGVGVDLDALVEST